MSEVKKIENAKVELTCTVNGDAWKEAVKKAFKKLASGLQIKGFRKGQAPESVLKKYITDEQCQFEAAQMIAQDTMVAGIKEHNLTLIDKPDLKVDAVNADECKLTFTCPVTPDVEIGDYKNLGYKVEDVAVDDSEVEKELDSLKDSKAEIVLKEDGALEKTDIAVMDFEGFKDGVPFEGGKGENYELTIGSGQFIPGFEDAMIGMKSGEEKEINVTFPEDYHVADLKGKPVVFKVKLHEIKKKVLAEITDELVKDLKIEKVNTVDELKTYIKDNILQNKKYNAENKAIEETLNKLVDVVKVDIPEVMIKTEVDAMFNEYSQRFLSQGISIEGFEKIMGKSVESIKEGFHDDAIKRIKTTLGLNKIAEIENVKVDQTAIDDEIKKMSEQYNMPVEEIRKYVTDEQVGSDLKLQQAVEFLKH